MRYAYCLGISGILLLAMSAASPLLTGCGKVCVAGLGDCSELNKNHQNQSGGDLRLTITPASIWVGNNANAATKGGKSPFAFRLINSASCQMLSYSAPNGTAVVQGVSRGPCQLEVRDSDGLVQTATVSVNGPAGLR